MLTTSPTEALTSRVFEAALAGLELCSIHLGWRLGLYDVLAAAEPLTPAELATRAGIDPRYAREWLEQQAVAGLIVVDDPAAAEEERRYFLPEGHAEVLTDPASAAFVVPFAPMVMGIAGALPDVVDAYRTGAGVPYERYGQDFREGQAAINRPAFTNDMQAWLEAIPGVDRRLREAPPARVADLGCGLGASTLAIARAYEQVVLDGLDTDAESVTAARAAAAAAGLADRVSFQVRDAASLADTGPYDLICIFEALHDMARPVEALVGARRALATAGTLLVVDERVADAFVAPGDEIERMMYGWSVSHCLPSSRAEQPSAALGTALRADTVRALAVEAGFTTAEVLTIANDFFRFYRMTL